MARDFQGSANSLLEHLLALFIGVAYNILSNRFDKWMGERR